MNNDIQSLLSLRDKNWRFPGSVRDTFRALCTIATHDRRILEGEPMGTILSQLISIESKPGGPYYSEFPKGKRVLDRTIDPATNATIARFLALYDVQLPNLEKFLDAGTQNKTGKKRTKSGFTDDEQAFMKKVRAAIKKRFARLDPEFGRHAISAIENMIRRNPDKQMSLMPYYMHLALGKKSGASLSLVVDMCVANIFFWTAFIIYDDFWDEDEAADPRLLPVANVFARSYTDFFSTALPEKSGFRKFFHELMDDLDGANAWETSHCRAERRDTLFIVPDRLPVYGDYTKKYRPASGHILGPLALLCLSGHKILSAEAGHLIAYFRHYLIAMQFNDDMHDWEEDIERGHVSTVIDLLLQDYGKDRKQIDLATEMDELRKTFWFTTMPRAARMALAHTKKSRLALLSLKSIADIAPLEHFVTLPEKTAQEALREQRHSVEFLKAYKL